MFLLPGIECFSAARKVGGMETNMPCCTNKCTRKWEDNTEKCKSTKYECVFYVSVCVSMASASPSVSHLISFPCACVWQCVRVCSYMWWSDSEIKHSLEKYSTRAERKKTRCRFIRTAGSAMWSVRFTVTVGNQEEETFQISEKQTSVFTSATKSPLCLLSA